MCVSFAKSVLKLGYVGGHFSKCLRDKGILQLLMNQFCTYLSMYIQYMLSLLGKLAGESACFSPWS